MTLDNESEDESSEVEDDESSAANFEFPSKATKHEGHTKHSRNGARKRRGSSFHASTKSSSSLASRHNILHKRGLKRGRNLHDYQHGSAEDGTDESSGAETKGFSSRISHGRSKRKRLGESSGFADTSDNDSDM